MNKINLASRRQDKSFDVSTAALERARAREHQATVPVEFDHGNPAVTVDLGSKDQGAFSEIVEKLFKSGKRATIPTEIEKEDTDGISRLKFQFLVHQPSRMLSAKQLARMLNLSTGTIRKYAGLGKLKAYRVGRSWRFEWNEVLETLTKKDN